MKFNMDVGKYFEFDREEYLITNNKTLSTIPKLGAQWKIMHDFRLKEITPRNTVSAFSCA